MADASGWDDHAHLWWVDWSVRDRTGDGEVRFARSFVTACDDFEHLTARIREEQAAIGARGHAVYYLTRLN